MDIHKPKPWRGVSEFLKEIGTIVIGVLIALGAEQVVANLHEARLSDEARAAVRDEVNLDVANMRRREVIEPCIARRLAELDAWVAQAEAGQPTSPPATIGAPGHPQAYTERWQAATAGGRTNLLSMDEQRGFGRVYEQFNVYQGMKPMEKEVWGDLLGLEGVRHPSPELLAHAREAIGRARLLDNSMRRTFFEARGFAAAMGVKGDFRLARTAQNYDRQAICLPLSTPADQAAKAVGSDGLPLTP